MSIRSRCEPKRTARTCAELLVVGLAFLLGIAVHAVAACGPALAEENEPGRVVAQDIQYLTKDAGEVMIIWGVNGWKTMPEGQRPAGTVVQKGIMQTPMKKRSDHFTVTLPVPVDAMLDFGFLITRASNGVDVRVWEGNGDDAFHEKVDPHHVVAVRSKASLLQGGKTTRDSWIALPYLVIPIVCLILPLKAGMLLVRRRHQEWQRRILLPAFKKPPRPSKTGDAARLGGSLLAGLALAEAILHLIDPHGGFGAARQVDWVRDGGQEVDTYVMLDPILGIRPRLNRAPYDEYGTVTSNYSIEKPSGAIRILVLGSQAVVDGRLVQALRQSHPLDSVEIWNGGVPSYGTMQTINFYKQYQSRIEPDKVILFITSRDIESTPIAYRDGRQNIVALVPYSARGSLNVLLFTHSRLYRLLAGLRTLLGDPEDAVLQEIAAGLSELAASLKQDRKELFVVSLPLLYPEDMWSAEEKARYAAIQRMLGRIDVRSIDLLPSLRAALKDKLTVRQYPGNPYEPTMALAERFIAYLDAQGLTQRIDARVGS